jgi:hypothetical protein
LANVVGTIESNKLTAFSTLKRHFPVHRSGRSLVWGPDREMKCGAGNCDGARTPQWPPDRSEDFSRRITSSAPPISTTYIFAPLTPLHNSIVSN